MNISGSLARNQLLKAHAMRKRMNTNHKRGPFHYRSPANIMKRTVRGMLPHTTIRGNLTFKRLRCFEGVPTQYETKKRVVVPSALTTLCLKPGRKYCRLGDLSRSLGWKYSQVIDE
uniref:Large ribosomal subunit protein uL13 n=1 Tax=Lygus hesperus TaxID=30085 RepID=A0A0A9YC23_LYGHE